MTIEQVPARSVFKPWGSHNLRPWSIADDHASVGELSFERTDTMLGEPELLLKLLFTKAHLSIQVHPDDALAKSMGQSHGKTEAWYVLSAEEGAQVAIGLCRQVSQVELRQAMVDGSITELVNWQAAAAGDLFFIPAGTIHAIGAGLVIAEIQQRSDTTFRLFDYGRSRELQPDQALAASNLKPTKPDPVPIHLTVERVKLVSCPFFVFERIELPPAGKWELLADSETWALVIDGEANIASTRASVGDVFFAKSEAIRIEVGVTGATILVAYAAGMPKPDLLRDLNEDEVRNGPIKRKSPVVLPFRLVGEHS